MRENAYRNAVQLLPEPLRSRAAAHTRWQTCAEEFRLRSGRDAAVLLPGGEECIVPKRPITPQELSAVLERATGASLHAAEEDLKNGFVTTAGGCRVGVCGTVVSSGGKIISLRDFSSVSVRIPHDCRGAADGVYPVLRRGGFYSTLILSPPGVGKTTLLRELVRLLSGDGLRVSLADERGEVAAVHRGRPHFDLGPCTDVMTGGTKARSAVMLLRAMSPQVLALDEITAEEDIEACATAANCGCALLATAHGADMQDLLRRPLYRRLLDRGIFRRSVIITCENGKRQYRVEELQ